MKPSVIGESERIQRWQVPTAVLGLDLSPDELVAYVGTFAGVGLLNLQNGEFEPLYAHESYVSGVHLIPETNLLVSSGYDGQLRWYDLEKRDVLRTIAVADSWIWNMAVGRPAEQSPRIATVSGRYLAGDYEYRPLPSDRPNVHVWDGISGDRLHQFTMLPPVQAVAFSPCGTRLAAANLMGDVQVWDLTKASIHEAATTRPPDWSWNTPDFTAFGVIKSHCQVGGIYAIAFTSDGQSVIVAGMGPMVDPMAGNGRQRWQRFSLVPGQADQKWQSKDEQLGEGLMETLAVHPMDGTFAMSGRLRGGAFNTGLFSVDSGDLIYGFKTDSRVTKARFLSDGRTMILAGALSQSADAGHRFGVIDVFRQRPIDAEKTVG
jgi:WD40 repeat protein